MTDAARWKATIYVGGLAPMVTVATIHDAFLPFGEIADVSLPKNENPNSNTTEPHRGFAYVEFEDADDAKEAMDNMDQSELFGRVIKVTAAKAPKSADEGLGSKKALWEQVGLAHFEFYNTLLLTYYRRAGLHRMLSVRRIDSLQNRPRPRKRQGQMIRCKALKGWMWLVLDQHETVEQDGENGIVIPNSIVRRSGEQVNTGQTGQNEDKKVIAFRQPSAFGSARIL